MKVIKIESLAKDKTKIPAMNSPEKITFEDGSQWIWKDSTKEKILKWRYIPSSTFYRREYLTYLVSEYLGWDLVPETKIVTLFDHEGSIQKWIDNTTKADTTLSSYSEDSIWKAGLQDLILCQTDRTKNNWLTLKDKPILIDNGLCMPIQASPKDSKSVIISRFAYKIYDYEIPSQYIEDIKRLDNTKLNKYIIELTSKEAFNLYKERVDFLLSDEHARFPGYKIVKRMKDLSLTGGK